MKTIFGKYLDKTWKQNPVKHHFQVSAYYEREGSYFGFDEECDDEGFETGFCPNDI